jgi:hypothetical protein
MSLGQTSTIHLRLDSSTLELTTLTILEPLCRSIFNQFGVELWSAQTFEVNESVCESRFVVQFKLAIFEAVQELVEILEQSRSIRVLAVEIGDKVYRRCRQ